MSLLARFDTDTLRVAPHQPLRWQGLPPPAVWQALARWCAEAAPGSVASACLRGGAHGEAAAVAEAFCRHLDGDTRMQALSPWQGRWWRLQIKLREATVWRARQPTDPWDCGYLARPAAAAPLAQFKPRRATFLVLDAPPTWAPTRHPRHPLRLLTLGAEGGELRLRVSEN